MIPPSSIKFEIALGAIILAAASLLVYWGLELKSAAPLNASRYELIFDNAAGLNAENPVTVAGVTVGAVEKIMLTDTQNARVTIAVQPHLKLFSDAKATIRSKSLLGEKYVSLDLGQQSPVLEKGAILANNAPTLDVDNVIQKASVMLARAEKLTQAFEKPESWWHRASELLQKTEKLMTTSEQALAQNGPVVTDVLSALRKELPGLAHDVRTTLTSIRSLAQNIDTKDGVDARAMLNNLDGVLLKLNDLLNKAQKLDEKTIREFLQLEGVRIRLWNSGKIEDKVNELSK